MANEPFFCRQGEAFAPTDASRGTWGPDSLHGRVVAGLLACEIERRFGDEAYVPARLTVDLYRLPNMTPAEVVVRALRDGHRIKVVDAEYLVDGVSMGRASCQFLRRSENPESQAWSAPNWDAPLPKDLAPPTDNRGSAGGMWESRFVSGGFGRPGARQMWMREVRALIDDEPLTPFVRAALAADFASPYAHAGDKGLGWINSDITLYLCRPMATEWIGFEAKSHQESEGVAVGDCWLYDEEGPIGFASAAALAQRRGVGGGEKG
jgi:hypothetical protein